MEQCPFPQFFVSVIGSPDVDDRICNVRIWSFCMNKEMGGFGGGVGWGGGSPHFKGEAVCSLETDGFIQAVLLVSRTHWFCSG